MPQHGSLYLINETTVYHLYAYFYDGILQEGMNTVLWDNSCTVQANHGQLAIPILIKMQKNIYIYRVIYEKQANCLKLCDYSIVSLVFKQKDQSKQSTSLYTCDHWHINKIKFH